MKDSGEKDQKRLVSSVLVQAKKYRQLATAYSLAAHEITLIKHDSENAIDDKSLSEFVIDSENAFSREHTQWVAKKST